MNYQNGGLDQSENNEIGEVLHGYPTPLWSFGELSGRSLAIVWTTTRFETKAQANWEIA